MLKFKVDFLTQEEKDLIRGNLWIEYFKDQKEYLEIQKIKQYIKDQSKTLTINDLESEVLN